jgi:prepilin-type N-terminal cleavage/methylation domain-containing protein
MVGQTVDGPRILLSSGLDTTQSRYCPPCGLGFTLIELLMVIAIIAVLAGLLLPSLGRAKAKVQSVACLNHIHQLTVCWSMYSDDNNGWLPPNEASGEISLPGSWVEGDAKTDRDTRNIEKGILFR